MKMNEVLERAKRRKEDRRRAIAELGEPPLCHNCGEPLKPYPYLAEPHAKEQQQVWGYNGNNLFCTMRCGFQFGIAAVRAGYARKSP